MCESQLGVMFNFGLFCVRKDLFFFFFFSLITRFSAVGSRISRESQTCEACTYRLTYLVIQSRGAGTRIGVIPELRTMVKRNDRTRIVT